MDSSTGKIYTEDEALKLEKERQEKLTKFQVGEVVQIKDCYFKIIYIRTDRSSMTIQGIPAPEREGGER